MEWKENLKVFLLKLSAEHNVKCFDIYKETKTILEKHVEETTDAELVPILYNTAYGGFGYSDEFIEFCGMDRNERYTEDRHLYREVVKFGKHLVQKENPDISFQYLVSFYCFDIFYNGKRFPRKDTRKALWMDSFSTDDVNCLDKGLIYEKLLTYFTTDKGMYKSEIDFNLSPLSVHDDGWYDPVMNKTRELDEKFLEKVYEKIGLKEASCSHCDLAVQWIPKNRTFTIAEYDGKENICVGSVLHDENDDSDGPYYTYPLLK